MSQVQPEPTREYVWTRAFGQKRPVSPFFTTPEEAGEWHRSVEGRATAATMLFGPTLRVRVNHDNASTRDATGDEWQRARAWTSSV